ncbi:hypothetical protein A3Q56_05244 [Intoshia linei]|uniref:Uncharacterized protein n=1 Tax=Intoshia linei TaxID=1819745 RepID=A0A177B0S5_9BILA|nr:hypothetical protein A3Q56_05244 [Intoshia linei]
MIYYVELNGNGGENRYEYMQDTTILHLEKFDICLIATFSKGINRKVEKVTINSITNNTTEDVEIHVTDEVLTINNHLIFEIKETEIPSIIDEEVQLRMTIATSFITTDDVIDKEKWKYRNSIHQAGKIGELYNDFDDDYRIPSPPIHHTSFN